MFGRAGTGISELEEGLERGRRMEGFPEKILLATDGLVSMGVAARAAVDLTEKGGAELHVVHVWHTGPSPHFDRAIRSEFERSGGIGSNSKCG